MSATLRRALPTALSVMLLASTLFTAYTATRADASHEPANKVAAAGSTRHIVGVEEAPQVIMEETLRVASPTDLMIQVQLECALITDVRTEGDDDESAEAQFNVWVTVDGKTVPVSAAAPANNQGGSAGDPGVVTFCNRRYERKVSGLNSPALGADDDSDDDLTIETFVKSKSTHGFNWIALNTGFEGYDANNDNILNVQVWADYTEAVKSAKSNAEAVIGNRTLIIEPDNFSVHEAVVEGPGAGN